MRRNVFFLSIIIFCPLTEFSYGAIISVSSQVLSSSTISIIANQVNQDYTGFAPPIISGFIKDSENNPVKDVVVEGTNGDYSDTTDANGYYELQVPQGWTGLIVPSKWHWFFEPENLSFENLSEDMPNQNFTAIPAVSISGYVTNGSGTPIIQIVVAEFNYANGCLTDEQGFYELFVCPGWSGELICGDRYLPWGRTFVPSSRVYENLFESLINQNFVCPAIYLKADGTGDFPTIQRAIDAAVDGDEVIIHPGVYSGPGNSDIDFLGKAITVRSIEPNNPNIVAATIIDSNLPQYVSSFSFNKQEGPNSILAGLTITRCLGRNAIICDGSSPTIRNCIIKGCFCKGIYLFFSDAIIKNCVIKECATPAIMLFYSSANVDKCIITDNGFYRIGQYPVEEQ